MHQLIDRVEAATSALAAAMQAGAAPDALLDATIAAAETVASAETLWSGDAGEHWPTRWHACARHGPSRPP